jgi:hypothetical protein
MKYAAWIICVCCLPNIALASPTTAERKSQFEKAISLIMTSATPTVSPFDRERLLREYMNGRRNKGQAVQLLIGRYYRSEFHEDVAVTGERTLEACQLRYAKPCALLAINEEIAAEGELILKGYASFTLPWRI